MRDFIYEYIHGLSELTDDDLKKEVAKLYEDYKNLQQKYTIVLENSTENEMRCEQLEDIITDLKQEIRNLGGD